MSIIDTMGESIPYDQITGMLFEGGHRDIRLVITLRDGEKRFVDPLEQNREAQLALRTLLAAQNHVMNILSRTRVTKLSGDTRK